MRGRRRHRFGLRRVFAVPALVALASIIGLVAGLTGDGVSDWISWALLSLPLAVLGWAWSRRSRSTYSN